MLYVRAHPLGAGDYDGGPARTPRVRMLGADRVRDINAALPEIDVLLTDYSSIAFDFALLGKPIVFLAADLETYAQRRGLYDSYREFSGGRYATGWDGALALLGAALDGDEEAIRHSSWLRDEYVDVTGAATDRVLDEILARTGGSSAAPVSAAPVEVRPPPDRRRRVDRRLHAAGDDLRRGDGRATRGAPRTGRRHPLPRLLPCGRPDCRRVPASRFALGSCASRPSERRLPAATRDVGRLVVTHCQHGAGERRARTVPRNRGTARGGCHGDHHRAARRRRARGRRATAARA